MELSGILRPLVLLGVLASAAVTDAARKKVYNILTGAGAVCIASVYALFPYAAEPEALMYECAFIAVLMVFYSRKMIGGADVKLYLLTIFAYPDSVGLDIIACSVAAAGIYALCIIAKSIVRGEKAAGKEIALGASIFTGAAIRLLH